MSLQDMVVKALMGFVLTIMALVGVPFCAFMSIGAIYHGVTTGDWSMFVLIGINATLMGCLAIGVIIAGVRQMFNG